MLDSGGCRDSRTRTCAPLPEACIRTPDPGFTSSAAAPVGSSHAGSRPLALRALAAAGELAVLGAWLLFVLKYQYGAGWLRGYDLELDLLFLGGVACIGLARMTGRLGVARTRALLLRLALAAAMTALALVAGEFALRFQFRNVHSSGDQRDYVTAHGSGPAVRFNSLGFRDREVPPKGPNRYRIAVIGDSFTFGNGLEERDRLSNQLEQRLGDRYEVFNFGAPGAGFADHPVILETALKIAPDFVLLQVFVNDFETPEMRRPVPLPLLPPALDGPLYRSSLVYDLVRRGWYRVQEVTGITDSYARYLERQVGNPLSPDAAAGGERLRGFFKKAQAAHAGVGAVMFPFIEAMGPGGRRYAFGYLHERVQAACADEHVRCVDLLPDFSRVADLTSLKVTPLDGHPSALANRRAANQVLAAFGPLWADH